MASDYPTSVDNETPIVDGVDKMQGAQVNATYEDITAVETFLGASGAAQSHNVDVLTYLAYQKAPQIQYNGTNNFDILAGSVVVKNSGGTVKKLRRNTATVNVTASNLDTGAMAVGYYYIYAIGDAAATTFTIKFSTTANAAPSGTTYYEMIGWFYNETGGVLDVTKKQFGNIKSNGRDVPNIVGIVSNNSFSTSSDTMVDDTEAAMRFYSSGRPVLIIYDVGVATSSSDPVIGISVDASDVSGLERAHYDGSSTTTFKYSTAIIYPVVLSAGTHTLQGRLRRLSAAGSVYANHRNFTVVEL